MLTGLCIFGGCALLLGGLATWIEKIRLINRCYKREHPEEELNRELLKRNEAMFEAAKKKGLAA